MIRFWERRPGSGDKSPLSIQGGARAVLCLHGFTGTPFEVRPLAETLGGQGMTVLAPALAGHCGTLPELGKTRWTDWLASAQAALDELRGRVAGAPVAIAGFSLGGLLALRLARQRPTEIAALVIMSAPIRLRSLQTTGVRLLSRLPSALRRGPLALLPKLNGYDVVDEEMQRLNPGHVALPLAGVASLLELGDVVRRDLPFVTAPTLVVHGAKDRTVPLEDSLELVGSLGSDVVERLWLPRSGHLVAIDVDRSRLIEATTRFLSQHLAAGAARAPRSRTQEV